MSKKNRMKKEIKKLKMLLIKKDEIIKSLIDESFSMQVDYMKLSKLHLNKVNRLDIENDEIK